LTGYLYNASGTRVAKGTIASLSCNTTANGFTLTNQYILGPNGEQMTEMAVSGGASTWVHTNVVAGGVIATYLNDNVSPHFRLTDWLGTTRAQTNNAGTAELTCQSLPFGDTSAQCAPATEQFFTGQERDSESGNDYFQARHYSSYVGRFLSPDPSGLLVTKPTNPQSWNLYAYVMNNPLTLTDPSGLDCVYGVNDVDHNSSSDECGDSGGTWVPGKVKESNVVYNDKTGLLQVASTDQGDVYYSNFAEGAQTNDQGEGDGVDISHADASWLESMFVGGNLDQMMSFMVERTDPVRGGGVMNLLAGPGLSPNAPNNWAGPGGRGTPQSHGDWDSMDHDYNFDVNKITILGTYLNPLISRATARAFIQSDINLIVNAGGVQGVKMGIFFAPFMTFQWLTHPYF
jgi:RHS repeat-associated protein